MTSPGGVNAQQLITISGNPNGGTYLLGFEAEPTDPLRYNANATDMQTALCALSTVGIGNLTVVKRQTGSLYDVFFGGALAELDVPLITADYSALNRGSVTVSLLIQGAAAPSDTPPPPSEVGPYPPVDPASVPPATACTNCGHRADAHLPAQVGGCYHWMSLSLMPVNDCECGEFELAA
jgi:hypothetical protein